MEYRYLQFSNASDLENIVNDLLKKGWKLYGHPNSMISPGHQSHQQAMILDSPITEHTILKNYIREDLSSEIVKYLKNGWTLQGMLSYGNGSYYQPMVRRGNKDAL